ncbi:MAG: 2-oxoacid:acceptor oxidoreductase family protein [Desulfobacterales bacterium]|nr:2-oxoacid:acceptor oxidoreductase family protein [Desulfobacterales bacterium]
MLEIRFHGRGGQGTVVASIMLAKAFFKAGYYVQTFPSFGLERRGAAIEAYLRLDNKKILIRSNLYTPDHVVVCDSKLINVLDVTKGLKPRGLILVNGQDIDLKKFLGFRIAIVDATRIAIEHRLGNRTAPIINTAMIGAFSKAFNGPPIEFITEAIENEIHIKPKENVQAALDAYEDVKIIG